MAVLGMESNRTTIVSLSIKVSFSVSDFNKLLINNCTLLSRNDLLLYRELESVSGSILHPNQY